MEENFKFELEITENKYAISPHLYWSCRNEIPQTTWLKTICIYCLTVLENRILKMLAETHSL